MGLISCHFHTIRSQYVFESFHLCKNTLHYIAHISTQISRLPKVQNHLSHHKSLGYQIMRGCDRVADVESRSEGIFLKSNRHIFTFQAYCDHPYKKYKEVKGTKPSESLVSISSSSLAYFPQLSKDS